MKRPLKHNPYSDALAKALRAVSELSNPDYILAPLDANGEMREAGAACCPCLSPEDAGRVYSAMIVAWNKAALPDWQTPHPP